MLWRMYVSIFFGISAFFTGCRLLIIDNGWRVLVSQFSFYDISIVSCGSQIADYGRRMIK